MNPVLQSLIGALSLFTLFSAITSAVVAGAACVVLRAEREVSLRAGVLTVCLVAPILVTGTLLFSTFLPVVLDGTGLMVDNCLSHVAHHPHLCFLHTSMPLGAPAYLVAALGASWLLTVLWRLTFARHRVIQPFQPGLEGLPLEALAPEQRARMLSLSRSLPVPVDILRSSIPFAGLVGGARPHIALSYALLELLEDEHELAAVIEHEVAHHARGDHWLARLRPLLLASHLPGVGTWLWREQQRVSELVCDEVAAHRLGSGLPVAAALLRLMRWVSQAKVVQAALPRPVLSMAGSHHAYDVTLRIERLVRWSPANRLPLSPWRALLPSIPLVIAALLASEPIHHGMEALLGRLSALGG